MSGRSFHHRDLLPQVFKLVLVTGSTVGQLQEDLATIFWLLVAEVEVAVTSDSSRENHVLLHHGRPLSMDCAKVRVFKKTDDVGLGSFLDGEKGGSLEAQVRVVVSADGPHKSLEGGSGQQILDAFLIPLHLPKGDSPGLEPELSLLSLLLHATFSWGCLLDGLGLGHFGGDLLLVHWHCFGGDFGLWHCV